MSLFRHHFRSELGALLGWTAALAALAVLMTAMYAIVSGDLALQVRQILEQLPPQMRQFFGGAIEITTLPGWLKAIVLSGLLPLTVAIWVALAAAGVITADRDRGTLEFILALPVRRGRLLTERWLALLSHLAILYGVIWTMVLVTLGAIGQSFDAGPLALALMQQALAQAALGGMILLLSLAFRDQVRGLLAAVCTALVFVMIPVFVEADSAVALVRRLTPFSYSLPGQVLLGGPFPWSDAGLLLAWAAAGFALALLTFTRQEV